jgi:hypothetical protein
MLLTRPSHIIIDFQCLSFTKEEQEGCLENTAEKGQISSRVKHKVMEDNEKP